MTKKMPQKKKKKMTWEWVTQYMFCLGVAALTFVFLTFAIAVIGFAVKVPITPYHLVLALAGTALSCVILSWYYYGEKRTVDVKIALSMMAVIAVMLLACGLFVHNIYDISFDGQWYHKGGILQLMNGYNPIYDKVPDTYSGSQFINDYPKAMEISSAVINKFTGHIEDGKLLDIFLMITAFMLIFPAIRDSFPELDWKYALIIAALSAANPISIYQSVSYYVDGVSASMLAIIVFLLILSLKKMDPVVYGALAAAIIYAINIKFFMLVYVAIIVVGFIVISYIQKKATPLHYLLIVPLVLGVVFGINPYIYNVIDHGTPFYPVDGISTSMITGDTPPNLRGQNSIEQFVYSIFSGSSVRKVDAQLKIPLTVGQEEFDAFKEQDARTGGFGPFFSAAFIVMAVIAAILVYMDIKEKRLLSDFMLLFCLIILASVLINPAAWWARYVPQFWLIPLLLLICACQRFKGSLKLLNYALIAIMAIDVLFIAAIYYPYHESTTSLINDQLEPMKVLSAHYTIKLYPGMFPSTEERLKEYGIKYVVIDNLTPGDDGYPLDGAYGITRFYVNATG